MLKLIFVYIVFYNMFDFIYRTIAVSLFVFYPFFFSTEQKPHEQGRGVACDLRAEQESAEKPFRLHTEDF